MSSQVELCEHHAKDYLQAAERAEDPLAREMLLMNWPPFRPDTRHNLEGLRLSSSTGLCLTTTNVSN